MLPQSWTAWQKRIVRALPIAVGAILLARGAVLAISRKVGHAGAPLDDAYIHFQYARAIAEGHPLRFHAGEPATSGATSILWPLLLAPFHLVGLRGQSILWVAWAISFTCLGLLAYEAFHLTRRLAGAAAALGAATMVLSLGAFTWFAASGMEVVPFAWAIARLARRSSEWAESPDDARTGRRLGEVIAMAWVAALFRPEGAVFALFAALTLAVFPRRRELKERAYALAAGSAAFATPLLLAIFTGSSRSTTTVAKLMVGNPYYRGDALVAAVKSNVSLLVGTLLNGEIWSAEFLPKGSAPVLMAGLVAIVIVGWRAKARWRAVAVLVLALTILAPCFYITFLWNRLRYLWPFATGFIVGVACLARVLGDLAGAVRPRWRIVTLLGCGIAAGALLVRMEWVIDDVAQSASGIDRQQVALGLWAKDNLPADARIGVNDTGAIAYFSGRKTFDVVGLTTAGEARYWVAGAGSRLEHYERLHKATPEKLPTHFIVYPEWLACEAVLGLPMHESTVTDSSILGGQTMRVYSADYSMLGSGELPWTRIGALVDELDVADLESEEAHAYELLEAHEGEQTARTGASPAGLAVVDGGRTKRSRESFRAKLRGATRAVVRLEGSGAAKVTLVVEGREAGARDLIWGDWQELEFPLAAPVDGSRIELRVEGAPVTVYRYWFSSG